MAELSDSNDHKASVTQTPTSHQMVQNFSPMQLESTSTADIVQPTVAIHQHTSHFTTSWATKARQSGQS